MDVASSRLDVARHLELDAGRAAGLHDWYVWSPRALLRRRVACRAARHVTPRERHTWPRGPPARAAVAAVSNGRSDFGPTDEEEAEVRQRGGAALEVHLNFELDL